LNERRANEVGTKFGGDGKRGRAKIFTPFLQSKSSGHFPRPFPFLPARAKNQKFFSKKVRASE